MSPEAIFDLYLDACVAGSPPTPDEFCRAHGVVPEPVLARMRALFEEARGRESEAPDAPVIGVPERIGEFRLLRRLGVGGMGAVYEAEQESIGRVVALKLLRTELVGSAGALDRFRREARAIGRLHHPNIVEVYGAGEDNGIRWMAMELLAGRTLEDVLADTARTGRTPGPTLVVKWAAALARALHHAHLRGIVHRDLKPSNIHIGSDGQPRLLDFGIAHEDGAATMTGTFAGSPYYAAPEQITGHAVDGRTDVYGLGVTLYRALAGRVPFEGGTMHEVVRRALADEPVSPRVLNPSLSRDLETVVLKAIQREPRRRYRDAAALADDLESVLANRPVRARPLGVAVRTVRWLRRHRTVSAAAGALIVVLVAWVVHREWSRRTEIAGLLSRARGGVQAYRDERETLRDRADEVETIRNRFAGQYYTPAEIDRLNRLEAGVDQSQRKREFLFFEILDLLRRAESLGGAAVELDAVRSALYRERMKEAMTARDDDSTRFYRDLARRYDRDGAAPKDEEAEFRIDVEPAGAELLAYRLELLSELTPGGGPRYVPVPWRDAEPLVPYGTVCLRVERGAGAVRDGAYLLSVAGFPINRTYLVDSAKPPVEPLDRLVRAGDEELPTPFQAQPPPGGSIDCVFERGNETYTIRAAGLDALGVTLVRPMDVAHKGGVPARVLQDGRIEELVLPRGLTVRPTAMPLLATDAARVEQPRFRLPAHRDYLLVARCPGHRERRIVMRRGYLADFRQLRLRLHPRPKEPDGYVYVTARPPTGNYWIMERELTSREYLEFLNDPVVRAKIDAAEYPIHCPGSHPRQPAGYWRVEKGKPIELKGEWRPDWPVLGLSFPDTQAYVAWRNERAKSDGEPWVYSLPTLKEWRFAHGHTNRHYVHGNKFRPHWVKGVRSHRKAFPEPVISYPVDESLLRVYDMTGSAAEWLDDWADRSRNLRRLVAGNWSTGDPMHFDLYGIPQRERHTGAVCGFRLVRRPR